MMQSTGTNSRERGEPTLPLINIVFLILIFFLVSAQLSRPLDSSLELVTTDDPELVPPPDALLINANGDLWFRGKEQKISEILQILDAEKAPNTPLNIQVIPDRRSDATRLVEVSLLLRSGGADAVFLVTQRALD